MKQAILILINGIYLGIGIIIGYFFRRLIVKKRAGTIEQRLQKKISQAKIESQKIIEEAKEKAKELISSTQKKVEKRNRELFKTQQILLKREQLLDKKNSLLEKKEEEFRQKVRKLKMLKQELEEMRKEETQKLEKIANFTKEEARKELFADVEIAAQKELSEKIRRLEEKGKEKLEKRAKEILAFAIQKYALPQVEELTTATVFLENENIKGRIIGKEGRNIRAFEQLTGVQLIIDETPDTVVISSFNPIRREIAKITLEKLIQDKRIQPAKIEKRVEEARQEVQNKIKEMGEKAVYEIGVVGVNEKLIQLLGRLYFRTSYGQNVLLHSMEVALIAEALADELGADSKIAKRAGLFHDIGKAVDHQIQGSHVDIGIKILEKFGEEEAVIEAMKSHHEEYPFKTIESILVKTADAISGFRPGARKETLENYIKRLQDLENIALTFPEVEKAYAIEGGREIRVFVKAKEIDDLGVYKLARQIADKIEEELKYPGEIKVNVIKETRVVEYAR